MRYPLPVLAIVLVLLAPSIGRAEQSQSGDSPFITDANIVTGLDVSSSMEPEETRIQIEGMAMAMRAPEILAAIEGGRHKRVGFAVFLWAEGAMPVFASWKVIGSQQEAREASDELVTKIGEILRADLLRLGSLTDVSMAMEYAGGMLRSAPPADRAIVNIVGDGEDNVREGPQTIRDELVAGDVTIDGIVIGGNAAVVEYFRQNVIGGPAAFVLAAENRQQLVEVFARKFVTEIVLNVERPNQDHR